MARSRNQQEYEYPDSGKSIRTTGRRAWALTMVPSLRCILVVIFYGKWFIHSRLQGRLILMPQLLTGHLHEYKCDLGILLQGPPQGVAVI